VTSGSDLTPPPRSSGSIAANLMIMGGAPHFG
jgi:hypothetical protein